MMTIGLIHVRKHIANAFTVVYCFVVGGSGRICDVFLPMALFISSVYCAFGDYLVDSMIRKVGSFVGGIGYTVYILLQNLVLTTCI